MQSYVFCSTQSFSLHIVAHVSCALKVGNEMCWYCLATLLHEPGELEKRKIQCKVQPHAVNHSAWTVITAPQLPSRYHTELILRTNHVCWFGAGLHFLPKGSYQSCAQVLSRPDDIAVAHGDIANPSVRTVILVMLHDLQIPYLQL